MGSQYGVNFFDRFYTCFIKEGKVEGCDFETLKGLYQRSAVTDDTIVFNNLVNTIEGIKNQWQVPLKDSWHKKLM